VPYLGYGRRKDHNLVQLPDPLHELVDAGAFYHINVVVIALDFHGDREVGLVEYLWRC